MMLSQLSKDYLQDLALTTVKKALGGQWEGTPAPPPGELAKLYGGAFVSIYIDGELRGCIGTFSEEELLHQNVRQMARSAALGDQRFSRVTGSELKQLQVEISVLTPRRPVADISEIRIGTHGIYLVRGMQRGTLLPQVAIQQHWNLEEFLGHCARDKAGLGWNGWKDADIYVYEALVFGNRKKRKNEK
jgi:AmmeMemoRadiSam system protein A